ncbi:MAG TPA: ArsA family ATPase [Longimicrobiales bacterium]|nr:ArsA family ATPase [Longimicrobiales bacterium]
MREAASLEALFRRRFLFFGGKGGAGKTTLAAAFAARAAEAGERTLLVSTDPAHSTADVLGVPLGAEPGPVEGELWAMEIDPVAEADRYIRDVKRRVADATAPHLAEEVARQIDVARVSPGAEESALFERFTRLMEEEGGRYRRLVFDTAPTGHTLRLLSLPELMSAWIDGLIARRRQATTAARAWRKLAGAAAGGAREGDTVLEALEERRERFRRARVVLTDAEATAFVFVVTAERLPILETERAVETLERYGIPVGAILVNQLVPATADGAFAARRRAREAEHLAWIRRALAGHPRREVHLREEDVVGLPALRALGRAVF